MSQPAVDLSCADLEQEAETAFAEPAEIAPVEALDDIPGLTPAELEAAFLMFGLLPETAELMENVVNDARPAFPELTHRGAHIEAPLAIGFIKAVDWIIVAFVAEFAARWGAGVGLLTLGIGDAAGFLIGALGLKVGMWLTEVYRTTPARIRPERGIGGLALGAIMGLLLANFFAPDARGAAALAAILPAAAALLAGIHAALAVWIRAAHKKGLFSETIAIVGASDAARRLVQRAVETGDARIIAIADDRLARAPSTLNGAPVAGNVDQLLAWEGLPHVDRIVIAVTPKADQRVKHLIERLRNVPNRVDLLIDVDAESVRGRRVDRLAAFGFACVSGRPRNWRRQAVKRAQDLVVGSLLMVALAPVMALIALAVKLDSRGPVLYRQRRHGFNNRVITVLKFRSMRHDPYARLRQVTPADPRVTRLGRFMRTTSLDELPQLWNVLKGEMSLVGPRPHAIGMRAAERELNDIIAEYAHRHRVKPGLTGWAQINGSRGPLDTPAQVRERVRLDLDYVSRASLWLDLQILVRTVPAVLGDRKAIR